MEEIISVISEKNEFEYRDEKMKRELFGDFALSRSHHGRKPMLFQKNAPVEVKGFRKDIEDRSEPCIFVEK